MPGALIGEKITRPEHADINVTNFIHSNFLSVPWIARGGAKLYIYIYISTSASDPRNAKKIAVNKVSDVIQKPCLRCYPTLFNLPSRCRVLGTASQQYDDFRQETAVKCQAHNNYRPYFQLFLTRGPSRQFDDVVNYTEGGSYACVSVGHNPFTSLCFTCSRIK